MSAHASDAPRSRTESSCRVCRAERLEGVLSLGVTPLANRLLTREEVGAPEPMFPLELVRCPDCSLVQLTETVDPELLFAHYLYFSSFSDTMVSHAKTLADRMRAECELGAGSLALEVASNDGYLLQHYVNAGVPVLGVEPAQNIAAVASERGIRTRCEFFGSEVAAQLRAEGFRADVVHANNVLAHVADLPGVAKGLATILAPEGLVVVEVPYVRPMIERCEFDTIYHEHLCYFSLAALERLFSAAGLEVQRVEQLQIHGGSLRLFLQHRGARRAVHSSVAELREDEARWGVFDAARYASFARAVEQVKVSLTALLGRLKAEGKSIAAYGAAAKGSTLLNYCGIGKESIDFVVDRSTVKQGHFMPGVHLEIRPPEALVEERPDYVVLLVWNFAEEVMTQQRAYRDGGGRFIVPVPTPKVAD